MELVKLEKTVDGDSVSKKVPMFSVQHGVEGLFLVIDHFKKATCRMNLTVADYWEQFEDVLDTVAEAKWTMQIANIGVNQRSMNCFEQELKAFVHV